MTIHHWPSMGLATLCLLAVAPPAARAGGWYLMLPPIARDEDKRPFYDSTAPLREWEQMGAYDSAKECEEVKVKMRVMVNGKMAEVPGGDFHKRCIATDDPRLTVDPRGPKK